MTFDELYPDARVGSEPQDLLVRVLTEGFCEVCGVTTRWMETEFQAYFCGTECIEQMYEDYEEELATYSERS